VGRDITQQAPSFESLRFVTLQRSLQWFCFEQSHVVSKQRLWNSSCLSEEQVRKSGYRAANHRYFTVEGRIDDPDMYSVLSTDIFRFVRAARSLLDSVRHRCAICASKSYRGCNAPQSRKVPREANCAAGATHVEKKRAAQAATKASARLVSARELGEHVIQA
jgi:hypothetical protein